MIFTQQNRYPGGQFPARSGVLQAQLVNNSGNNQINFFKKKKQHIRSYHKSFIIIIFTLKLKIRLFLFFLQV